MTQENPAGAVSFAQDDLLTKELFEGVTAGLAWGDKLMLSLVTFDPQGAVPEHAHPHEQAGVCLEGRFELRVEGTPRTIEQGQMYIVPSNASHSARALGTPCKTLDIFAPPREEYKS